MQVIYYYIVRKESWEFVSRVEMKKGVNSDLMIKKYSNVVFLIQAEIVLYIFVGFGEEMLKIGYIIILNN